jgi:hypothetical protein
MIGIVTLCDTEQRRCEQEEGENPHLRGRALNRALKEI